MYKMMMYNHSPLYVKIPISFMGVHTLFCNLFCIMSFRSICIWHTHALKVLLFAIRKLGLINLQKWLDIN